MRKVLIVFCLPLLSCNTPSPRFAGAPVQRVQIAQSIFDVRIKDRRAEAIRLNSEWAPRLEAVAPRARAAIRQVSGCEVARLRGDAAMILADLKCEGQPVPPPPQKTTLYCEPLGRPYISGTIVEIDIVCEPA